MSRRNSDLIRPLNGVDRFLMAVDRTIRRLGGPGFETQTFLWLADRVDASRLSANLAILSRTYPIVTARLVEQDGPYWQLRPGTNPVLQETHVRAVDAQAVVDEAAKLFSGSTDPAEVDPVLFHLLHRPDGRDVLLVQYNHALLDHNDAVLMLRQLNALPTAAANVNSPQSPWHDCVREHLRRFPRTRRRAAALTAERWRQSLRGGALQLGRQKPQESCVTVRLITRRLDAAQTSALKAHITRICGVPSISMGVLACAFRAIGRLTGSVNGDYLNTGIGVDLGLSRGGLPAMQNLTTLVPVRVDRRDLGDRDILMRLLNSQLRAHLVGDMDLGVLQLATTFGRHQRRARWTIELLLRYCVSLWYGSFGTLDGLGAKFCEVPIEEAFSAGPTWPPVGLTLLVNQFAGRLHLQATYIPECVSDSAANGFLDELISDLPLG